jgi:hypothetical protein
MADDTTPQDDQPPQPEATPETGEPKDDGGKGGKEAILADLTRERAERKKAPNELEQLRASQMTETEKAIAEAEARGRTAASTTFGQRLAGAEFVAAAARRNPGFDASAVLGDLNLAKYVSEDGEPDSKGIATAVERLVPAQAGSTRPAGDVGQGVRTTPPVSDMNSLIRQQVAARRGG